MAEAKSLLRDQKLPSSLDYQELRREGISHLQKLSGKIWTDYNEHDPGVTILEQLCYALTDVAFRTNTQVEKILFHNADHKTVSNSNALYGPHEIFPTGAITQNDYRILIIDSIKEVNNAWIEPVEENKLGITGLYDVVIQISNDTPTDEYEDIKNEVRRLIAANRNLCEDINEVKILLPLPISISAEIDIKSDAVGEEVLSELFYRVNNYFNPVVQFYSFEELEKKNMALEKIFETASFKHGFILPEELRIKNDEFYVTKIAELVSSIPGIRNVQNLTIYKNDIKVYGNSIRIESGYFPHLEINKVDNIEITKGGLSYDFDQSITSHLFEVKIDKQKNGNENRSKWQFDKVTGKFSFGSISDFSSVQNSLPGVYGVGRYGLPDDASEERKAKATQLKAYLLMFDVIMSNHLVQLEKLNVLFSTDYNDHHTYYAKLPKDFPELERVLNNPTDQAIQNVVDEFDNFLDRKNRVLDHILSRFGEQFSGDLSAKIKNLFGDRSREGIESEIVHLKSEFIKDYVKLSRDRARTFNYLLNSIDENNTPVFKQRVCFLLNIKDHRQKSLVHHYNNIKIDVHAPGSKRISKGQVISKKGESIQYRENSEAQAKYSFLIKDRKSLDYLLLKGDSKANYHIVAEDANQFVVLFYTDKKEFPVKVLATQSLAEAQKAIHKLVTYFSEINKKSEGFHVVEHILLRPYGVDEFHFQILGKDDSVLFESISSDTHDRQKLRADDALMAGCDKSNYKRSKVKSGKHVIILKDKHNVELARLTGEVVSEEGAAIKIDELVKYFKELEKDVTVLQKKVVLAAVKVEKRSVNKEFYNSGISVVLPAWISRFQNEEFQLLLRNSIRQSIPAYIAVSFVWMDIDEMKQFEFLQKQWLELRQQPDFDWKKLNQLSAKLISILTVASK